MIPFKRLTMFLALVLCTTGGVTAQQAGDAAEPVAAGQSILWNLRVEHGGGSVTISRPDGVVMRQEFKAGDSPIYKGPAKGDTLPDGAYVWELVLAPRTPRQRSAAVTDGSDAAATPAGHVVSGSFIVAGGVLRLPEQITEGKEIASVELVATPEDQVIPDDLIVQGSGCFGFDCVNNESFGFDTIRLKENNLRIKFEDTSTGSFPTNDWQLTANDSASGGASKFSIEDITGSKVPFTITAGASTNSMFVDSTGRVGFRTSTPVLDLHVATSNTPAMRLEQNNSGGFTAQTWDIAGNEANFFVRDVTSGSRLPFRIRPGAPTSSIDISAEGKVGFGTASPTHQIHVVKTQDAATQMGVENKSVTATAAASFRVDSDAIISGFTAHSSARTISRFGKTLGGWAEMSTFGGNGLAIGTTNAMPLVLGTNSANRLEIGGNGGVTVNGNFTATGTKNFAVTDPTDAKKAIYFAALEGPEAGTYFRGSARTIGGEAVIELPAYFANITETKRLTVQLTPVGSWGQLYVAEKSPGRLVIRVAPGGADLEFDYLVQGVRSGYLDYEIVRDNNLPR